MYYIILAAATTAIAYGAAFAVDSHLKGRLGRSNHLAVIGTCVVVSTIMMFGGHAVYTGAYEKTSPFDIKEPTARAYRVTHVDKENGIFHGLAEDGTTHQGRLPEKSTIKENDFVSVITGDVSVLGFKEHREFVIVD